MIGCGMIATGAATDILHEMQKSLSKLAGKLSGKMCMQDKLS
jgi:hypothetical protein